MKFNLPVAPENQLSVAEKILSSFHRWATMSLAQIFRPSNKSLRLLSAGLHRRNADNNCPEKVSHQMQLLPSEITWLVKYWSPTHWLCGGGRMCSLSGPEFQQTGLLARTNTELSSHMPEWLSTSWLVTGRVRICVSYTVTVWKVFCHVSFAKCVWSEPDLCWALWKHLDLGRGTVSKGSRSVRASIQFPDREIQRHNVSWTQGENVKNINISRNLIHIWQIESSVI